MNFETVTAEEFGASLRGLGLNLLVRDVAAQADFLADLFGMTAHRVSADFAIMAYGAQVFQLHADGTYRAHPLQGLLPEAGPRGAGLEIRLYDTNPDAAAARAAARGAVVLQPPTDKPHGLRETCILCDNGYAWVASQPKPDMQIKEPET
ncbi:glyoxalase [Lutimaribacter sp. EGI FJ00015]|uniref:Glyoxalase n=1 Tax=Lutimaribacter degradans TaxID=2945989 RepID=A0ACC5ZWB0_9RHOB|nr:VOC family protein [Lutimaribacter sp. EGI FJ00013]MCM2562586.1 glyoxalase [Lutimaribacter sp. EGI FJ00013]MCO0613743.1 glyoxalase [Lutimaribacter sp. EGI FJ00015]MCO0636774.1 glyoxalase [Lutimaribacter sp. EGI FJ00014]